MSRAPTGRRKRGVRAAALPWAALLLMAVVQGRVGGAEPANLLVTLDPASSHHLELTPVESGLWEIKTTGVDPFVATQRFAPAPTALSVLTFEYICLGHVRPFEVFVGFPWREAGAQTADELPYSEGWSVFSIDLRAALERTTVPPDRLRLDFGTSPGQVVQSRNLRLRAPEPGEDQHNRTRLARLAEDRERESRLRGYLARTGWPAEIAQVVVRMEEIELVGRASAGSGELWLAESPIWEPLTEAGNVLPVARLAPEAGGRFALTVPRRVPAVGGQRDRLYTRWAVLRRSDTGAEVISAARYADSVTPRHSLPGVVVRSKKGLGGFNSSRADLVSDLDTLGIASVTVNLFLSRFLRSASSSKTMPFVYNRRTYHADRVEVERLDRTLRVAAERGILVLGIVLVPKAGAWDTPVLGRIMQHPDCLPAGTYSMANVTSAEGVEHYAALLDFLAERYSRPGQPFGRIHHWIVHNEVDAGWTWTNCGEKSAGLFVDQYHKSMRLVHLIARQYDPGARAYVSLTHHWAATASFRYIPGREILERLLAFSRAEGDFDWGIAHHPYPESLREPKSWLDRKPTFAFDTPMITFKNLEVLDAWVRRPATRFRGEQVRSVHLSEQGPNSRDYSEQALAEQAASMAYAWKKLCDLETIEGFQYHNWIDNRREGGLRIGLRRFPDDPEEPLGKKPIWHVYQALGTPAEDAACAFALPMIGVKDWRDVRYRGKIAEGR